MGKRMGWIFPVLLITGCQTFWGPVGYSPSGRVDDPRVSIEEQKSRGRLRLSVVEDDRLVPKAFVSRPDPLGS